MIKYTLAILLSFSIAHVNAQATLGQILKKAKEAEELEDPGAALFYYNSAYELDPHNQKIIYGLAKSALKQNAYGLAERNFNLLLDSLESTSYDEAYYYAGVVKQTLGKYREAQTYFDLYLSVAEGDDPALTKKSKIYRNATNWAKEQILDSLLLDRLVHFENDVNGPYSEHAANRHKEGLSFSSLSFELEDDKFKPNRKISKVMLKDSMGINEMKSYGLFNNDKYLTSGLSYTKDGSKAFTSICQYINGKSITCQIYCLTKGEDNNWTSIFPLPEGINAAASTNTHPAVGESVDGATVLYFSSNREGGKGARDIYMTTFDQDMNFSDPKPIEKVNTILDEVSPYYSAEKDMLYFSSDGHPGLGGYDIYSFQKDSITNLGHVVNTSYNEIHYSRADEWGEAYFSSNRPGSYFLDTDQETCCYDIYRFDDEVLVDLKLYVYDGIDSTKLIGTEIITMDMISGDMDESSIKNDSTNVHLYSDMKPTGKRQYFVAMEGYRDGILTLDLDKLGIKKSTTLEREIYLERKRIGLEVAVFEKATKEDLLDVSVGLYDPDSGELIRLLTNSETNKFTFDLIPGKKYEIRAEKTGYDMEVVRIEVPLGVNENIKKEIYLGRVAVIETLANLIPLRLYYDNDRPDPRTTKVSTSTRYKELYQEYYSEKEKFKDIYSRVFAENEKEQAKADVEEFFDSELKKGFNTLSIFMETLHRILKTGKKVNLYLRGYASPLSVNDYNVNLSKRRVSCVRNEFRDYENGILMKFIVSGQLVITERGFGESSASSDVSDDARSPSKSIYSPKACKERRMEIDEIQAVND